MHRLVIVFSRISGYILPEYRIFYKNSGSLFSRLGSITKLNEEADKHNWFAFISLSNVYALKILRYAHSS